MIRLRAVAETSRRRAPRLESSRWKRPRLLSLARLFFSLCCIVWVVHSEPGLWVSVGAGALAAVVVLESRATLADAVTAGFGLATFVAALDYISWRIKVVSWGHAWISVPLLLAETLGAVHIVGLQYTLWPRKEADRHLGRKLDGWPVWVLVPTVDEGPEILEPTIRAIQRAADDFRQAHPSIPIRIVICNDGGVAGAPCATSVEELARRLGVVCITRTAGGGAKAGNIEYCRQTVGATGEALLVVFDADQCPEPAFFLETLPLMADPQMGWVQTGQYYRNLDNPVARWANDQQALFYRAICPGKSAQNAAFICGTNVVINAVALDEIGGFPTDSVTEDFAASIRLHVRWHSVFVPGVLATGLGPEDLPSYFKQQRRWARGTFGVLGRHWKDLVLPRRRGRGLSGPQRIHYALACTHYLSGLRDVVYVVAPLVFLLTGAAAVHGATLAAFVWHFIPYFVLGQAAFWYATARQVRPPRGGHRVRLGSSAGRRGDCHLGPPPRDLYRHVQAEGGQGRHLVAGAALDRARRQRRCLPPSRGQPPGSCCGGLPGVGRLRDGPPHGFPGLRRR